MNEQTALWHIFKHKRGSEVWKQFHWEIQAVAEKRFNDRIDYSLRVKNNNNNPTTNLGWGKQQLPGKLNTVKLSIFCPSQLN